ncbi:MAG: hypothetical protein AAF391_06945, partial [Bacteroidota bacterium]
GTSHEFAHHFSGALVCGCFGYKTFNSFELCAGCNSNPLWILPTYIGPIFTFALMWVGLYQLKKGNNNQKQLGLALVFANFPVNRILFALMGSNDEQYAASILFGSDNMIAFWVTNGIIWTLAIPPLWYAYKAIDQQKKGLWFLGYFLLPFLFVIVFAGIFLEEWLLLKMRFLAEPIIGIPYLILLVEALSLGGYILLKKNLYQNPLVRLK